MSERLDHLYRAHVAAVFRFALACVGRRDIAEEVTSDTFVALLRHLDEVEDEHVQGWLITVARNRARDYWRHEMADHRLRAVVDPEPTVPPEEPGDDLLFHRPELKPAHRVCLHLRYVEGLTRAEISRTTGLSETQVKGHLQYALHLLREVVAGARP
jgi:RNA polymerase sigma-70 factor (ECF subfamily)